MKGMRFGPALKEKKVRCTAALFKLPGGRVRDFPVTGGIICSGIRSGGNGGKCNRRGTLGAGEKEKYMDGKDCRQGKASRGETVPVESDTPQQAIGDWVYAPLRPGYFHAWFLPGGPGMGIY